LPIIGGLIGAGLGIAGSLIGGERASDEAMTGYDYAVNSPLASTYLPNGGKANNAAADLLGVGGDPAKSQAAFDNYLKSTGYDFQMKQGQNAIVSSNAAKGLLNSGATAKGLTEYGQGLGASYFDNYLKQLGGLSTQGLQAGGMITQAGTEGGKTSADALGEAWGTAGGIAGKAVGGGFGQGWGGENGIQWNPFGGGGTTKNPLAAMGGMNNFLALGG
jgi:hypothetical protein